jgi:hypothetical protein
MAPRALGRRCALLVAALASTATALAAVPGGASAEIITANPASIYRDSVGVQTHFTFSGYAYDREPIDDIAAMLKTLGVRHVRDNVCLSTEPACARPRQRIAALKGALGPGMPDVKFLISVANEIGTHPERVQRDADIERGLTALTQPPLAGMIDGIEPSNEPDLQGTPGWASTVVADDVAIHRMLKQPALASLRTLPLLTPPLGIAGSTSTLLSAFWNPLQTDVPNFHPYPPAWGGPENGLDVPCGAKTSVLTALDCVRKLTINRYAPIATETGYSTAGYAPSPAWVSEAAENVYMPRLLLDNFARGVARTYLYELIDLQPDKFSSTNGFGLWRARYAGGNVLAGGPKPAANAISRLAARIGDLGAKARYGWLDMTIADPSTGAEIPAAAVRRVLLRRADGSFVLALWQPKSVWNATAYAQRMIPVPDLPVKLTLTSGVKNDWQATTFRPSIDDNASQQLRNTKQVTVNVGPDVTLVDLRGTNSQGAIPGGPIKIAPNDSSLITPPVTAAK